MPAPFRLVMLLAAGVVVVTTCGSAGHAANDLARRAASSRIPVLVPWSAPTVERDTPPAVRARIEREQRALTARARAAARETVSVAAGCERSGISGAPHGLGPPSPKVTPRIIGHHVEVVFTYPRLPSSDACRPFQLTVVTYSGHKASSTYNNFVERYLVSAPGGRVVVDLPWSGHPPYHLIVSAETILGLRGRAVEVPLLCPGTGSLVKGCLPAYRPGLHSYPMPTPVLPLRGVRRATLEATLRYVVAREQWPSPRRSRCRSLRFCEITYVDPAFPHSPYRVRYRIAGEQIPGCWMGIREAIRDPLPYQDVGRGRLELAGCASWLH
jgi:hypothetical protein